MHGHSRHRVSQTALDRLLDWVQRCSPKLSQMSDVLVIAATGLLALVDVAVWATDPRVDTGRLSVSLGILVPALGAVAIGAVSGRRRHLARGLATVATAGIALTVASVVIGTSLPPSFAALFAVGLMTTGTLRREPGRTAVMLAILAALAVAAEALRPQVGPAAYLLLVCEGALLVAAGVGIYVRWSDWRQLAAADTARSDERLEIARELHDMVGHHLTGIVVQAQAARHLSGRPPEADRAALQQIERAGTEALVTMRRMVGALRDDAPTAAAPDWSDILRLTSNSATPARIATASITAAVRDMDATLAPSVHRIVAESLTNVERHGRDVRAVEVAVFTQGDDLVVTVRNDGSAVTSTAPGGFGIVGMRERATSLGGSLSAGSVAGGGWLVRAQLPMHGHP